MAGWCGECVNDSENQRGVKLKNVTQPASYDIMTLREVAEYLGCAKITVYRLIKRDEFPAFRLNTYLRFRRADIERWIAQQHASQAGETVGKPVGRGWPRRGTKGGR